MTDFLRFEIAAPGVAILIDCFMPAQEITFKVQGRAVVRFLSDWNFEFQRFWLGGSSLVDGGVSKRRDLRQPRPNFSFNALQGLNDLQI